MFSVHPKIEDSEMESLGWNDYNMNNRDLWETLVYTFVWNEYGRTHSKLIIRIHFPSSHGSGILEPLNVVRLVETTERHRRHEEKEFTAHPHVRSWHGCRFTLIEGEQMNVFCVVIVLIGQWAADSLDDLIRDWFVLQTWRDLKNRLDSKTLDIWSRLDKNNTLTIYIWTCENIIKKKIN